VVVLIIGVDFKSILLLDGHAGDQTLACLDYRSRSKAESIGAIGRR
jgi:hypothetical protein